MAGAAVITAAGTADAAEGTAAAEGTGAEADDKIYKEDVSFRLTSFLFSPQLQNHSLIIQKAIAVVLL